MQRSAFTALCKSLRELSNEYLLAKVRFDTAENEPCKVCPLSAYRSPRSVSALFRPLQELSFIRYAFRGVLVNEFKDQTYQCDKRADVCFPTGQAFLEHMDFGDSDITSNALPLLYFFLAMNVLAYVVLLRTRMNNIEYFPPNFEGLVLGCIDADFCK